MCGVWSVWCVVCVVCVCVCVVCVVCVCGLCCVCVCVCVVCVCVCNLNYPSNMQNDFIYDIFVCGLPLSTEFLHMISETVRFSEKKLWNIERSF